MAGMFNRTVEAVTNKLQGTKYHHNLLGESLADLMRKATSKTLVVPDEDTNQLVSAGLSNPASRVVWQTALVLARGSPIFS